MTDDAAPDAPGWYRERSGLWSLYAADGRRRAIVGLVGPDRQCVAYGANGGELCVGVGVEPTMREVERMLERAAP